MSYIGDVQTLEPGTEILLFELDASAINGDIVRFYGGHPIDNQSIIWQGNKYAPWPIELDGLGMTGDGQQPTPTIKVGDIDGSISSLCFYFNDLVGAKIVRHRTLSHYLDAANFPGGNTQASPSEGRVDAFYIQRKSNQIPGEQIEFELSSPLDFNGMQLPARQIIQNVCPWLAIGGYRGAYCGYTGSAYFDKNNNPVADPALDVCAGRLSSCKCRFGENNPLPFGGFPAAGLIKG